MTVTIVSDPRFGEHDPGPGHPERRERLAAIEGALATSSLAVTRLPTRRATDDELSRAHDGALLAALQGAQGRRVAFDSDTRTSPGSVEAAYLAAGGAIELAVHVVRGSTAPGIALVRPPGHHATRQQAMGFCLLNNIAIATYAILDAGLAERVAIYDWDVHHGNGTQEIFYEDGRVLYLSTHQSPLYPGTGAAHETGRGPGEGTTVNVPLPAGTGDEALLAITRDVLAPRTKHFAPGLILISAGFDASERDPLGGLAISAEGFRRLADAWRSLAESTCHGRIALVLEGGYDLDGLGQCVVAALEGLCGRG